MISDSVIFVRNPACNNFHGTSSGAAPSLLPDLDPIQVSPMHCEFWEFRSTSQAVLRKLQLTGFLQLQP